MSLRQAFKAKFRSEKGSEYGIGVLTESKGQSNNVSPHASLEDLTRPEPSIQTSTSLPGSPEIRRRGSLEFNLMMTEHGEHFRDLDKHEIFELQLTQLQEQLVAAMLENQQLNDELHQYRDQKATEKMKRELLAEKQKNLQLTQELQLYKRRKSSPAEASVESLIDVAQEATEDTLAGEMRKDKSYYALGKEWLFHFICEFIMDFTEDGEPEADEGEGDSLTVKKLKDNIKRFKKDTKPVIGVFKSINRLYTWKNPSYTLIVFFIYMYSAWQGWLIQLSLLLVIVQLSLNYLRARGLNTSLTLISESQEDESKNRDNDAFKDLGVSDKFNLVLQVARQVQNTLGKWADYIEKIKNLLTWKKVNLTREIYLMAWFLFVLSCLLPTNIFCTVLGLYMGIKVFIFEYLYDRFPRFKQRHDSSFRMWRDLPSDKQAEQLSHKSAISKVQLPIEEIEELSPTHATEDEKTFCETFNLPLSESPLSGWHSGRRCTLINREKSIASAFKHGRLYLTRSFLCFCRSRFSSAASKSDIIIPLSDITHLDRAKPYSWLPGAGMALEVHVKGHDKPYLFGVMLNRDESYESIMLHAVKAGLPWSSKEAIKPPQTSADKPCPSPNLSIDRTSPSRSSGKEEKKPSAVKDNSQRSSFKDKDKDREKEKEGKESREKECKEGETKPS